MKRRLLLLMAGIVAGHMLTFAQTSITGTVVAEDDGEPIVGATVKVVGTDKATITDIDGKFSISAPADAKLEFTYVGMTPQTNKARRDMVVTMRTDQQTLDDVLVVAYGTQKKSAFTGSAIQVNAKDISQHVTTDPLSTLVGKVPGLVVRKDTGRPGSGVGSIRIRGVGNIDNSAGPLIITDGVEGSLYTSPEDIESITVLKDAASAALYGSRAANGVILITTKSGGKGKANITFDMKLGSNSRAEQDYDRITDPGLFYETYYGQLYNRYVNVDGLSAADANLRANEQMLKDVAYNIYNVPVGQQLIGADGRLNPAATLGRTYTADGITYYLTNDNWKDETYKNSFRQEYNMTVSGGNTKNSYYVSGNYTNDNGIIERSGYEKIAVRGTFKSEVKKWLNVGAVFGISHARTNKTPELTSTDTGTNVLNYTNTMAPIYPIYVRALDSNGQPYIMRDANGVAVYDFGVQGFGYPGLQTRPFGTAHNPLSEIPYNIDRSYSTSWNANITGDIIFTDWLKLNLKNSFAGYNSYSSNYQNMLHEAASVGGILAQGHSNGIYYNLIQQLDFHKLFGKHDVSATLAHDFYNTRYHGMNGSKYGGYSTSTLEFNYFAVANELTGSSSRANREGWLARGLYSYDDRYFGSISYRRDISSGYAKKHKAGNFWSVGGAWQVNNEPWYHVDWLNYLKVKASIGQVGNNIGFGGLTYLQTYRLRSSGTTMSPILSSPANEAYTWETTTTWNIGMEFGVLNNLITGSFDVYYKKVKDMGMWLSLPQSTGYSGFSANAGDMSNRGFELDLTANPIRTKDINWTINLNMAHNTTKVLKLPSQKTRAYGGFVDVSPRNFQSWFEEGGSFYNAFMPAYAGVSEDGQALYYVDSEVPETERTNRPSSKRDATTTNYNKAGYYTHGSIMPKVNGGFSTSIELYGFDVSAYFDYQLGGKVYDFQYALLMAPTAAQYAGKTFATDVLKSWTPQNTNTNIPRFYYGDSYTAAISDRFLTSARYLNFQSFTVGYTLPAQLIRHTGFISKVRVYVAGENLCYWSARKGLDPRFSYRETSVIGDYSLMRNISGGIQITF